MLRFPGVSASSKSKRRSPIKILLTIHAGIFLGVAIFTFLLVWGSYSTAEATELARQSAASEVMLVSTIIPVICAWIYYRRQAVRGDETDRKASLYAFGFTLGSTILVEASYLTDTAIIQIQNAGFWQGILLNLGTEVLGALVTLAVISSFIKEQPQHQELLNKIDSIREEACTSQQALLEEIRALRAEIKATEKSSSPSTHPQSTQSTNGDYADMTLDADL